MSITEKQDKMDALAFRVAISRADDAMLLTRSESGAVLGMTVASFSNAVSCGRLPKPYHIGGGIRGLPRWKLGDLRALMDHRQKSKSCDEAKGGRLSDAA